MAKQSPKQLALTANTIRQEIVKMLATAKSGHTAGALGMTDIFAALYFHEFRSNSKNNPKKPNDPGRDFCFLSNGHICAVLYATLAEAGYFPKSKLKTFRKLGSPLQGHPHALTGTGTQHGMLPGVENSGGPLGQGLSQAAGAALALKRDKKRNRVYCISGDGEHNEGQAWEAAMFAAHYQLDNLVVIVDRNKIQIDGFTGDVMETHSIAAKYRAFNWNVIKIDGHDFTHILAAFERARNTKGKPTAIIAHTVPGRGVQEFQSDYRWHGKAPNEEQAKQALTELQAIRKKLRGGRR